MDFDNKCPPYLKDKVDEHHGHTCNTRSSQFNFVIAKIKGVDASFFFYFNAIKDWNALPNSIKAINDHNAFKAAVKQHLKNK